MKKLLIGSVYGPGNRNSDLLWLQHMFFSRSIEFRQYDHVLVFNSASISLDYKKYRMKVVGQNSGLNGETNESHAKGLSDLLKYFMENRDQYSYFMFIDSDAWPIKKRWISILEKQMNGNQPRDIAVVIRNENLERRLHSSILFCKPNALANIKFNIAPKGGVFDVMGQKEMDVWTGPYYQDNPLSVFPLIRTNQKNDHPVWSGIYYDMFYHHGGGSKQCKGRSYRYYHHIVGSSNSNRRFSKMKSNPCDYISELAGWSPTEYIKFKERL